MKKRISILLVVAMLVSSLLTFSVATAEGDPAVLIYGGPNFDASKYEDVVYFEDGYLAQDKLGEDDAAKTLTVHAAIKNVAKIADFGMVLKYDATKLIPAVLLDGAIEAASHEYEDVIVCAPTLYKVDSRNTKGNEPTKCDSISAVLNLWTENEGNGYGFVTYNFNTGANPYKGKDATKYVNVLSMAFLYADGVTAADLDENTFTLASIEEVKTHGVPSASQGALWVSETGVGTFFGDALDVEFAVAAAAEAPATEEPTADPTADPTEEPTADPTAEPTADPTEEPTADPTEEPTADPTEEPTADPTEEPTADPTEEPTADPTADPTEEPTADPTEEPTADPTAEPTEEPATAEPTEVPSDNAGLQVSNTFFMSGVKNMVKDGINYTFEAVDGFGKYVIGARKADAGATVEHAIVANLDDIENAEYVPGWSVGIPAADLAQGATVYVAFKVTAADGTEAYYTATIVNPINASSIWTSSVFWDGFEADIDVYDASIIRGNDKAVFQVKASGRADMDITYAIKKAGADEAVPFGDPKAPTYAAGIATNELEVGDAVIITLAANGTEKVYTFNIVG